MQESRCGTDAGPHQKKPYTPPTVTRVPLRPEEAVLGYCKNSSMSGPRGGTCTDSGPCAFQGS
jgi:hypothetical protein